MDLVAFEFWHSPEQRKLAWNAICRDGPLALWLEMTEKVIDIWHFTPQNRREHACAFLGDAEIHTWFERFDRETPDADVLKAFGSWSNDVRYSTGHDWIALANHFFCRMSNTNVYAWIAQRIPSWIKDSSDLQTQFELCYNFLRHLPEHTGMNHPEVVFTVNTLGTIFRQVANTGDAAEWVWLLGRGYVPYNFSDARQLNKVTGWFERHIDTDPETISQWIDVLHMLPKEEQGSIALHWCMGVPRAIAHLQPWMDLDDTRWIVIAVEHYPTILQHPDTLQWRAVHHAYTLRDVWSTIQESQKRAAILALYDTYIHGGVSSDDDDTSWL